MLNPDQRKIVTDAYRHLIESESKRTWDKLDDDILFLEYLNDDQLHREADVIYEKHRFEKVGCTEQHAEGNCFIPILVEAVSYILELYKETSNLHEKNRYVLQYYLALNQSGLIVLMES